MVVGAGGEVINGVGEVVYTGVEVSGAIEAV
jgi:hypothetical protein